MSFLEKRKEAEKLQEHLLTKVIYFLIAIFSTCVRVVFLLERCFLFPDSIDCLICGFPVLVKAYWEEGKINEAVEAVQDMEQRGVIGTASVYYELACCLCRNGRWQDAMIEVNFVEYGIMDHAYSLGGTG